MARTKISEFSATPGNNTDIDGINIAEGCAPSGINDAIRELMAQLKDFQAGTAGDSFNGPVGTTTAAAGAFTTLSSTGNTTLGDAAGDTVTVNGTATFANANPTLSAGTANGVAYLNGSKVLTTGSGLVFDGTNLGLGVTPSTWSLGKAFEIGHAGNAIFDVAATQLTITQNAYYNAAYKYGTTAAATRYDQAAGQHIWYNAPSGTAGNAITFTQAMTLDASGNLGVGTTSPSATLHVKGGNTNNLKVDNGGQQYTEVDWLNNGTIKAVAYWDNTNTQFYIGAQAASSSLAFATGGGERARIDSSGNFLVGVTSTMVGGGNDGKRGFSVQGVGTSATYVVSQNATDTNFYIAKTSGYTDSNYVRFYVNGSQVGGITTNGTGTAYNTSSDYRLKENIQPMTSALAKVAALKPCTYKWKADGSDGEGFIAHELAEVVPQCVTGEKDAVDAEGKPVYQGIDTSFLVATLTAALQEQQAIINQINAKVEAQAAEIAALKGQV